MKKVLFIVLSVVVSSLVYSQRVTINGYVADSESGERLIGATLLDTVSGYGTVTNNSGFYTLTLPRGNAALRVSYVGYRTEFIAASLTSDTLINVSLTSNLQLSEVTVVGSQSVSGPMSAQMSVVEVPVQQIKGIPALGGEVDVLKAIQLLPGVQSGTEGSAGVYVRGGGPDENLIMLDGVPLYSVNHMMGFFSVFNADAIKNVTLYKGNFPARFGSRLSSIIDVRQNDGNLQSYHGNVTVGLIAAKANVEGPIIKGKTSFNISARRTYADLFTAPVMAMFSSSESQGDFSALSGYYFYDVNAKITHRFSDNDKLSASFYMGDDKIYIRYRERENMSGTVDKMKMGLGWNWGNLLGAASWEHRFNSQMFATTQLSFTRYRYNLRQTLNATTNSSETGSISTIDEEMSYHSNIMDVTLQSNFEFTPNPRHDVRYGGQYIYHRFNPQVSSLRMAGLENVSQGMAIDTTVSNQLVNSHEVSLYAEDTYTPLQWLRINYGLHGSLYFVGGKVYPSLEPRLGLRALITNDLAFKASYSYMSQYIHMLSNSSVSLPTDLWVPVTKQIDPMRSLQAAAGLTYNILGQVELTVEGYYKYMKNLLEYKDGATFMGSSTGWENKVSMGNGWSYGVELLVQRKIGNLTGWVAYTWSRTMRQFNREGQVLNYGKPFRAKYDREHDLSITMQYQINKRIDVSGTFIFSSGNWATLALQRYFDYGYGRRIDVYEERNNYQMPNYHRLDLGVNFHVPHHRWQNAEHVVNISVYNVYNSMNPFLLYPDEYSGKLYKVTIFPILPSLSYTFKF